MRFIGGVEIESADRQRCFDVGELIPPRRGIASVARPPHATVDGADVDDVSVARMSCEGLDGADHLAVDDPFYLAARAGPWPLRHPSHLITPYESGARRRISKMVCLFAAQVQPAAVLPGEFPGTYPL